MDEETQADVIRAFELAVVPGLLQIEDYARELLSRDEQKVAQRMKRQEILARETPPTLHVVLDEGVLHRERGSTFVSASRTIPSEPPVYGDFHDRYRRRH